MTTMLIKMDQHKEFRRASKDLLLTKEVHLTIMLSAICKWNRNQISLEVIRFEASGSIFFINCSKEFQGLCSIRVCLSASVYFCIFVNPYNLWGLPLCEARCFMNIISHESNKGFQGFHVGKWLSMWMSKPGVWNGNVQITSLCWIRYWLLEIAPCPFCMKKSATGSDEKSTSCNINSDSITHGSCLTTEYPSSSAFVVSVFLPIHHLSIISCFLTML